MYYAAAASGMSIASKQCLPPAVAHATYIWPGAQPRRAAGRETAASSDEHRPCFFFSPGGGAVDLTQQACLLWEEVPSQWRIAIPLLAVAIPTSNLLAEHTQIIQYTWFNQDSWK